MIYTHPPGRLLTALWIAALLMAGCADKPKPKPSTSDSSSSPSMFSSVKNLFSFGSDDKQRANIAPVVSEIVGYTFGKSMDKDDLDQLNTVLEISRSRKPNNWTNKKSGNDFTVTPLPVFLDPKSRYCRELNVESLVDGRQENVRTVACRRPDSVWEVQG